MPKNQVKQVPLYEIIILFFGFLGLTSVLLLTFGAFKPLYSIIISFVLLLSTILIFKWKIVLKDSRFNWIILLILLIALVMRVQPWIYLDGGQDEGVYISMSKQFENTGGIEFKDNVTEYLKGDLLKLYQDTKGYFVAGLATENTEGENHFIFYPLHPALLSITGFALGDNNRSYELTIFSIISVIGAYLLAYEISKKKIAGYIAAGLLVVSPLHLYFSRFPVGEMLALAFTLNTLYFLLKAWKTKESIYFLLTLMLINMMLYLRMTWIVSLPFYLLLLLAIFTYEKDKIVIKKWAVWGALVLISFLLSSLFYYLKLPDLYILFYKKIFKYIPEIPFYVLLFSIPLVYFLLVKYLKKYLKLIFDFIFKYKAILFYLMLVFIIYLSASNFYSMAFTDKYLGTYWDKHWEMSGVGWYALKDMPISSVILYLSPLGFLLFTILISKIKRIESSFLFFFLFLFLGFNAAIVRYTPYQFYYARYQLSEIVPIIYIFISIYLVMLLDKKKKFWFYFLIIPLFLYNAFFCVFQYQGYVGTTPKVYNEIQNITGTENVVIYYNPTNWHDNYIFTPLKYYFNQPAINTDVLNNIFIYGDGIMKNTNKKVYVLSTIEINSTRLTKTSQLEYSRGFYASVPEGFEPFEWKISNYQLPYCKNYVPEKYCSGIIPVIYHLGTKPLYLYLYK
ncbi:glycosyltransferase family 39 protein [Candidatus Dojkabacteria bacterium]|jgi:hypothetical protein|nr:glycosyltransferase family 39 protein [Candidatus Dojkabacteria bacterium]